MRKKRKHKKNIRTSTKNILEIDKKNILELTKKHLKKHLRNISRASRGEAVTTLLNEGSLQDYFPTT